MGKEWPEFGGRLATLIQEKGYPNAAQFADAVGIRVTYVYKWIGGTMPKRAMIVRLAEIFGVSPAWLMFGDEVAKEPARPLKRVARRLACLVAALLLTAGMVPAEAGTLSVDQGFTGFPLIGRWRRSLYQMRVRSQGHTRRCQVFPGLRRPAWA